MRSIERSGALCTAPRLSALPHLSAPLVRPTGGLTGPRPVPPGVTLPNWAKAALALAGSVALAGLADAALARAGYPTLGATVWVVGYGGAVFAVWLFWVRHLDISPP